MIINKTKQYIRRGDGDVITILTVNAPNSRYPVIAMDSHGAALAYTATGRFWDDADAGVQDLIEMPVTVWVAFAKTLSPTGYMPLSTQRNQQDAQCINAVAVVPVVIREGDGLL